MVASADARMGVVGMGAGATAPALTCQAGTGDQWVNTTQDNSFSIAGQNIGGFSGTKAICKIQVYSGPTTDASIAIYSERGGSLLGTSDTVTATNPTFTFSTPVDVTTSFYVAFTLPGTDIYCITSSEAYFGGASYNVFYTIDRTWDTQMVIHYMQ